MTRHPLNGQFMREGQNPESIVLRVALVLACFTAILLPVAIAL